MSTSNSMLYNSNQEINASKSEEYQDEQQVDNIEEQYVKEEELEGEEQFEEEGELEGEEQFEEENIEQDNNPKEYSFDALPKKRPQLLSQLPEDELERINKYNLSINALGCKMINSDGSIENVYGIGLGEPEAKLDKTLEVLQREFKGNPKVSVQEDNICTEQNNSLYMYSKPNGDGHTVHNVDNFTIGNDQRKTDSYVIAPQNSFKISDMEHGWQYFNTYGQFDDRTRQKLEGEIFEYWNYLPEDSRQKALDAIVKNDVATMNDIMNNTFAQVTSRK